MQSSNGDKPLNWLFLPGGPGLGSETFLDLGCRLDLPGTVWYINYPNDGGNHSAEDYNYDTWCDGLVELLDSFYNVVVVAHSFSGMFVLSDPRIESKLSALVLLNTSPSADWMSCIASQAEKYGLPDISEQQFAYQKNPSDELFKQLTLACAEYFFTKSSLDLGIEMLQQLPYSHSSYDWATNKFHPSYRAAYIPQTVPTLVVGGEYDYITPITLFSEDTNWQRSNIIIECINGAGHFPWLGTLRELKAIFNKFSKQI